MLKLWNILKTQRTGAEEVQDFEFKMTGENVDRKF